MTDQKNSIFKTILEPHYTNVHQFQWKRWEIRFIIVSENLHMWLPSCLEGFCLTDSGIPVKASKSLEPGKGREQKKKGSKSQQANKQYNIKIQEREMNLATMPGSYHGQYCIKQSRPYKCFYMNSRSQENKTKVYLASNRHPTHLPTGG